MSKERVYMDGQKCSRFGETFGAGPTCAKQSEEMNGTSIFDPVLCELAYRWFCPPGGVVLDPFGLTPGLPELVWDPIAGCANRMVAERRAKAFTAGTMHGATNHGSGDAAARFYAAEAAKVLMAYFHAAALTGKNLDAVLEWVAKPLATSEPEEILRNHPFTDRLWAGLLTGALRGDERTSSNTVTTVQQAMSLFFQDEIRRRCVPDARRPARGRR